MPLPGPCLVGVAEFCAPDTWDCLILTLAAVAIAGLYWLKWRDPYRRVIERITGRPWWRN